MTILENINLTDDPLKNICLMAPYLDEAGQNKVFGMMCGLIGAESFQKRNVKPKRRDQPRKTS